MSIGAFIEDVSDYLKARPMLIGLAVFLAAFVVNIPTLFGTFYYDDNVIFLGHQVGRFASNPFAVFSKDMQFIPGAPRSLHVFTLILIYKLFGSSPFPYHLFNLILHSATAYMVFRLARELGGKWKLSVLSGLIFGLHPVHIENITFVTLGGTDVYYTFWALISLLCYIWFRKGAFGGWRNYILLCASVLFLYFGLLCKESAPVFVIMYPMAEIFLGKGKRGVLYGLPHLLTVLAYKWGSIGGLLGFAASSVTGGMAGGAAEAGARSGIAEIVLSLGFFVKSLVIPYPLNPLVKEFSSQWLLYASAGLFGVSSGYLVYKKRWFPAFGLLWFGATAAPYLLVPFIAGNVAVTAERYIYMPSIGFAFVLAWALAETGIERKTLAAICAVVLLCYAVLGGAYFYSSWRSEEAFWRYAIKMNPDYVSGYSSVAESLRSRGDEAGAEKLLIEGLGKSKGHPAEFSQTAYSLGEMHLARGDKDKAERYFQESLRYGPFEFAFISLGALNLDNKNYAEAANLFDNALMFRTKNPRALVGMSMALRGLGRVQESRQYAAEAYSRARDPELRSMAWELMK